MVLESIQNYIGNTHYIKALTILVISFIAMKLLLLVFEQVFKRLSKKTKTDVDDLIIEKTKTPLSLLLLTVGARIALESLTISETVTSILKNITYSFMTIFIAYTAITIINILITNWIQKYTKKTESKMDDDLLGLLHSFTNIALYIFLILYILKIWGVEITPILASLGVAGLAIALAIKPTLENIISGITLIIDQVVRVGDIIQLDSGEMGEVTKIALRSTKIRTFNNELITVPNSKLADSIITNWNLPNNQVRININFGVEYGTKINKVKELSMKIIEHDPDILKEPEPMIIFTEMADSALNFTLRFWIADISNKLVVKDRITTALYNNLNKNKIGIPFPTQTVYVKK